MSTEPLSDVTAGQRAQQARLHPELEQPILDPTDPRYGTSEPISKDQGVERPDRDAVGEHPRP